MQLKECPHHSLPKTLAPSRAVTATAIAIVIVAATAAADAVAASAPTAVKIHYSKQGTQVPWTRLPRRQGVPGPTLLQAKSQSLVLRQTSVIAPRLVHTGL